MVLQRPQVVKSS